jgi:triphosphoribosyl-dephospho-CoA synthase
MHDAVLLTRASLPRSGELVDTNMAAVCSRIGRAAVRSLYEELALYPKPGLVSLVDSGSHDDMDASTFVRSLFSLRRYFVEIARAGADEAPFARLRELGIAAESRMLAATGGINTHRGAIFSIGMLCAAAARSYRCGGMPASCDVRHALISGWGDALCSHRTSGASHGACVAQRYAVAGAREEAAAGFPSIFELALPRLRRTLREGRGLYCAKIDTLLALMAQVSDTNVYHRGGASGALLVREAAADFMAAGGTAATNWRDRLLACHAALVAHRLSPGGAADMLGATLFVHALTDQYAAIAQS